MILGGLVRQGEISFTIILSLHIHSMRCIKEWTAKKNPDPGDIPVIQSSTFQCSVWGGGRRNHTEPRKQGKIQSNIWGGEEHHGLLMQMLRQYWGRLGITVEPDSVKNLLQSNTCVWGGGGEDFSWKPETRLLHIVRI